MTLETPQDPSVSSEVDAAPKTAAAVNLKKLGAFGFVGLSLFLAIRSCQPAVPKAPNFVEGYADTQPMPSETPQAQPQEDTKDPQAVLIDQASVSRNVYAQETLEAFQNVTEDLTCVRTSQIWNDAKYEERSSGMPMERNITRRLRANQQELARVRVQQGGFTGKAESIALARALLMDSVSLVTVLQAVQQGRTLDNLSCALDPSQGILWAEKYLNQSELVFNAGRLRQISDRQPEGTQEER